MTVMLSNRALRNAHAMFTHDIVLLSPEALKPQSFGSLAREAGLGSNVQAL